MDDVVQGIPCGDKLFIRRRFEMVMWELISKGMRSFMLALDLVT